MSVMLLAHKEILYTIMSFCITEDLCQRSGIYKCCLNAQWEIHMIVTWFANEWIRNTMLPTHLPIIFMQNVIKSQTPTQ